MNRFTLLIRMSEVKVYWGMGVSVCTFKNIEVFQRVLNAGILRSIWGPTSCIHFCPRHKSMTWRDDNDPIQCSVRTVGYWKVWALRWTCNCVEGRSLETINPSIFESYLRGRDYTAIELALLFLLIEKKLGTEEFDEIFKSEEYVNEAGTPNIYKAVRSLWTGFLF